MREELLVFIRMCENNYGISTAEFIEWFDTTVHEKSETEKTWYRYAKSLEG